MQVRHGSRLASCHPGHPGSWTSRVPAAVCPHVRVLRSTRCRAAFDRDPIDALVARDMAYVDRQMELIDRAMDRQMQEMDLEFSRMMERSRALQAEATRRADEAIQRAEQGVRDPNVQIYRSEERGVGSYRFQESITITTGPRHYYSASTVAPAVGPSPLLFVAALLAGAYAALAAAFVKNIGLTTYKEEVSSWRLALLWPVLILTSSQFRSQFWAAVRGQKPKLKEVMSEGSLSSQDTA